MQTIQQEVIMKLALNFLPCESFKKKLVAYFTLKFIIKGFMISILLSLFIFLDLLNLKYIANLGLLSAIIGLYILLKSDRKIWFWSGFFIGLFWFYWISFSLSNSLFLSERNLQSRNTSWFPRRCMASTTRTRPARSCLPAADPSA